MQIKNLYGEHAEWVHFINQALKAHYLFEKDVDYINRDGEIIIVDENTRASNGRTPAIPKVFTKRLKRKKAFRFVVKIKRWHTITFLNYFACMRSFPV
jgi:preprotein translocase subunit SecA